MVTTAHLFQNFLDYLSFQKSYSSHTVDAYLKDLEQFEVYQIKEFDVTLVSTNQYRDNSVMDCVFNGGKHEGNNCQS